MDGGISLGLYSQKQNDSDVEMYVYGGRLQDKRGCGMGVTVFPTGGVYEGEFLNGELHGKGHLVYKEGDTYNGMWKNNVKHGHGEYHWCSGNTYIGEWVENRREGPMGLLIWSNGDEYCGDWLDNKRTGNGGASHARCVSAHFSRLSRLLQCCAGLVCAGKHCGGRMRGMRLLTPTLSQRRHLFRTVLRQHAARPWRLHVSGVIDMRSTRSPSLPHRSFRGIVYDGPWLEDRREGMGVLRWEEDGMRASVSRSDLQWLLIDMQGRTIAASGARERASARACCTCPMA